MIIGNPPECPSFITGDGHEDWGDSGEELAIKDPETGELSQMTDEACIQRCLLEKRNDWSINGVTVYQDNRPGCFCERKMTHVQFSVDYYGKSYEMYKTCLLPKGNLMSLLIWARKVFEIIYIVVLEFKRGILEICTVKETSECFSEGDGCPMKMI